MAARSSYRKRRSKCSVCRWNKKRANLDTTYRSFSEWFKAYTSWARNPNGRPHNPHALEQFMIVCRKHEPEMAAAMLRVECGA